MGSFHSAVAETRSPYYWDGPDDTAAGAEDETVFAGAGDEAGGAGYEECGESV